MHVRTCTAIIRTVSRGDQGRSDAAGNESAPVTGSVSVDLPVEIGNFGP